jgi:SAM-dependent methyltransferase
MGDGPRASAGNPWDALSDFFDTTKIEDEIPAGAADNILIAWPVFFSFLDSAAPEAAGRRALDFGCGTGSFAHALHRRGYAVTGIDPSPAMIARARAAYGEAVDFRVGDASLLRDLPPIALITSIMALQFVAEIEATVGALAAALAHGGHLVFAVHHPGCAQSGMLHFSVGVDVPIFVRTAEDYHALARSAGLTPVLEAEPPFTEEFVARYPGYAGQPPEYLILGYEKY